jgi:hypothetical protein
MLWRRGLAAWLLLGAGAGCSCRPPELPEAHVEAAERPGERLPEVVREATLEELLGEAEAVYVECEDEARAETVLAVHVTVPNLARNLPFRVPLARRRARKFEVSHGLMHGFNADGRARDGRGIGYGGGYGIVDATESSVTFQLSLYWTANDGATGSFDDERTMPVGRPGEARLAGGAHVRWAFEAPPGRNGKKKP